MSFVVWAPPIKNPGYAYELHRTGCQLFGIYQELAALFALIWVELKKLPNRSVQFADDMH